MDRVAGSGGGSGEDRRFDAGRKEEVRRVRAEGQEAGDGGALHLGILLVRGEDAAVTQELALGVAPPAGEFRSQAFFVEGVRRGPAHGAAVETLVVERALLPLRAQVLVGERAGLRSPPAVPAPVPSAMEEETARDAGADDAGLPTLALRQGHAVEPGVDRRVAVDGRRLRDPARGRGGAVRRQAAERATGGGADEHRTAGAVREGDQVGGEVVRGRGEDPGATETDPPERGSAVRSVEPPEVEAVGGVECGHGFPRESASSAGRPAVGRFPGRPHVASTPRMPTRRSLGWAIE